MLWSTFSALERKHLQEKVQIEAEDASDHVYAELRSRIPALQRMARRCAIRGGTPWNEFLSDATSFMVDLPGFQALNLAFEPRRRAALEGALAEATRELESRVAERTKSLTEAHARIMEQRLLQSDLELAGQVQVNLTPRIHPLLEGFDFAARALPSRFLNGDFFEYEVQGRDCFTILLADIAGKGLSAAEPRPLPGKSSRS